MEQLIKVTETNGQQAVSARELHKYIETWHYNENYNGILISSFGRVKNYIENKPIKIYYNSRGYQTISCNTKRFHLVLLHRIVAETFYGTIGNKMTVNHINGNKQDNRSVNLEIITYSENNKHAYLIGLKKGYSSLKGKRGYEYHLSKEISQYDFNLNLIETFGSLRLASEKTKVSRNCISNCAKGIYKQAGGFIWRFGSVNTYPLDVLKQIIM